MSKIIQLALIVICGSLIWKNAGDEGFFKATLDQVNHLAVVQSLIHGSEIVKN